MASSPGAGRRVLGLVIDLIAGALLVAGLFLGMANTIQSVDNPALKSVSLRVLGTRHWLYVKSGSTLREVHDTRFWILAGVAVGWVVIVVIGLRLSRSWTPGRWLAGVRASGDGSAAPPAAPPAAMPGGAPQWDAARGTYIQWDPTRMVWLQWSQTTQQWTPLS
jgi:hypothetical protein